MSRFVVSNNASALLVSTVTTTDVSIALETGAGGLFPTPNANEHFMGTLIAVTGQIEIVKVTGKTGDTLTVLRGQEGTAAQTFAAGSRFECRITAGMANGWLQRAGDSMNGPLNMNNNQVLNAQFAASPVVFGIFHAAIWRAQTTPVDQPYTTAENAIYIPANTNPEGWLESRRPGYMGRVIVNTQMMDGLVFDWQGDVNNLPTHLRLCNGSNFTPDLRGKFIRGWTETFGVGGAGGADTVYTSEDGSHGHAVQATQLGASNLPPPLVTSNRVDVEDGAGTSVIGNLVQVSYSGTASHGHGMDPAGVHRHVVQILPSFYVLAKVMFTV